MKPERISQTAAAYKQGRAAWKDSTSKKEETSFKETLEGKKEEVEARKEKTEQRKPKKKLSEEKKPLTAEELSSPYRFQVTTVDKPGLEKDIKVEEVLLQEIVDHIVESARVGMNEKGQKEFQFNLKSDVLGGLKLRVSVDRGKVSTSFVTESDAIKEIVQANAAHLIKVLENRGLGVVNFSVTMAPRTADAKTGGFPSQSSEGDKNPTLSISRVGGKRRKREPAPEVGFPSTKKSSTDYTI